MNRPVVNALIQARMGSSRLPGKVMTKIAGEPLLAHVVRALKHSSQIDNIIVCTTTNSLDDSIKNWALENEITCVRGSEDDVLDRFCSTIQKYPSQYIVRITADDPLLDPKVIDKVIKAAINEPSADYCSNVIDRSWPRGLDCEVVKTSVLLKLNSFVTRKEDREHVTIYIRTHSEKYQVKSIVSPPHQHRPYLRFCVDTPEDLSFVRQVYHNLSKSSKPFGVDTVIDLLDQNPKLTEINRNIQQISVLGHQY